MPRYYFHVCDGTQDIDDHGHELPDDNAARHEAVRYGGGLIHDDPSLLLKDQELRINVTNDDGQLRFAVVMIAVDADWRPANTARHQKPASDVQT